MEHFSSKLRLHPRKLVRFTLKKIIKYLLSIQYGRFTTPPPGLQSAGWDSACHEASLPYPSVFAIIAGVSLIFYFIYLWQWRAVRSRASLTDHLDGPRASICSFWEKKNNSIQPRTKNQLNILSILRIISGITYNRIRREYFGQKFDIEISQKTDKFLYG